MCAIVEFLLLIIGKEINEEVIQLLMLNGRLSFFLGTVAIALPKEEMTLI